ncbi:DUF72 domain-containing protein [Amycolatopsis sp. RM579]|uniref:DUF72 domain-containing protein n=2 Tax=Amycolatopsis pithecellobii TaxID=664692 RepID=A0A6N7Z9B3_9PSEU|nr:DUF72 domain-containing protein [Amycolatopsis pithecellobii]
MRVHVGCAMWTHPAWPLPERLRSYASWCNAVEGNTTFYATPAASTISSWVDQTPPDFRLLLKLPKAITHERRLGDVAGLVRSFLDTIEPLGERVHALWVQLPASFGPPDLGALAAFLRRMPRDRRLTVEVRHPAFFAHPQRLEQVLGEVGAEWVLFDTTVLFGAPPLGPAEEEAWQQKPRLPRRSQALTAHPVVRYIGRDDDAQTVEGWQHWVDTVVGWLREGRSPTVFVHTPDNARALVLARRFHDEVRARLPDVEPLPEPLPSDPLTLF